MYALKFKTNIANNPRLKYRTCVQRFEGSDFWRMALPVGAYTYLHWVSVVKETCEVNATVLNNS